MIEGTHGVYEDLEYILINVGSYLFYLVYFYYWWEFFNGDNIEKDVKSVVFINFEIAISIAITTITIFTVIFVILVMGGRYNSNVLEAKNNYNNSCIPKLPLESNPNSFLPMYLFYFFQFFVTFCITVITSIILSSFLVSCFDVNRLKDPKYSYVCRKVLMVANLVMFFVIFELFKPSTKIHCPSHLPPSAP